MSLCGKGKKGDDDRGHGKPRAIDTRLADSEYSDIARQAMLFQLRLANMGTGFTDALDKLLDDGGRLPLDARNAIVRKWEKDLAAAPPYVKSKKFSELAEAFLLFMQAARRNGVYDFLFKFLVEEMTQQAEKRANAANA